MVNVVIYNIIKFLLVIFIIGSISYAFYYLTRDDTRPKRNPTDNRIYNIKKQSPEKDAAALEFLSELQNKVTKLVSYMQENSLPDQFTANRLYNSWAMCQLRETSSFDKSIAMTIDKGTEIRICIRDNNKFEDINTAMFVILHELAHIMSVSVGHTQEFYQHFYYITHLASYLNLYVPENFMDSPKTYCGTTIKTTPCSNGTCKNSSEEII
jgi:hypothetical protein